MTDIREPTLRVTMLPRDTNAHGTIFGGVILSHIDLAGGIAASRQAPRNFVTRAMREVEFIAPVYVGDVVNGPPSRAAGSRSPRRKWCLSLSMKRANRSRFSHEHNFDHFVFSVAVHRRGSACGHRRGRSARGVLP